jgi:hypothetical protein
MNQFNEEPEYKKCVRCKQMSYAKRKFCDTCLSKNCEEKNGRCVECKQINTGKNWCQNCNSKRFQQNFDNWTSGNDDIDKFIQNTQLSANNYHQILEWMPYNIFGKLKYIAESGFGKVYRAAWKNGCITHWDTSEHQWKREFKDYTFIALKTLNKSQNITLEFINEVQYLCNLLINFFSILLNNIYND